MQKTSYSTSIPEIDAVVDRLCQAESLEKVWSQTPASLMPSTAILQEIMQRLRAIVFPGYFGSTVSTRSIKYHIAANLDSVFHLLRDQITRGFAFVRVIENQSPEDTEDCKAKANAATIQLIEKLPEIRELLANDAQAAYEGDPAAVSPGETIFCYPSLYTMFHHRIAHVLYTLKIPLIPRIIQEMAHSKTGIDIHPGANIGSHFFIDHGTGVVIGETSIIGEHCRLYQGVTLGALSFPKQEDGTLIKGIERHPVLGDHVTVYAGATILGRVHIGDNCIIGGNVWVTEDVPAGSRIIQGK